MQRRTALEISRKQTDEQIVANLRKALERNPLLTTRDLRAHGLPGKATLRRRLGTWADCMEWAGRDPTRLSEGLIARAKERKEIGRQLGFALADKLCRAGQHVQFDGRLNVLDFQELRMRLRVLWPTAGNVDRMWRIRVERISRDVSFDLLVRMEGPLQPKDFFVVPPQEVVTRFPEWLIPEIPLDLHRYWCRAPRELLERIRIMSHAGGPVSLREMRDRLRECTVLSHRVTSTRGRIHEGRKIG